MDNPNIVDIIVKYSIDCIKMRFIRTHLNKSLILVKSLPITFRLPSADTIKIVIDELSVRLQERESDIGKLLSPLFEGKDFDYNQNGKNSLSLSEIKDGYILLKEVCKRDSSTTNVISYKQEEHVILLRKLYSKSSGFNYNPGVLYKLSGGLTEKELSDLRVKGINLIPDNLLELIINKKNAYEYLKQSNN